MSKFKINEFQVNTEGAAKPGEVRVVKETKGGRDVRPFEFEKLRGTEARNHAAAKQHFAGIEAAGASKGSSGQLGRQKDKRFSLHELVRGPLSIEEEELQVIEEKVQARLAVIQERAKAEAARQGYQQGLEKGYEESFKRFREEGAARLQSLDGVLAQAEAAKDDIFRANEKFLMEMIYRIARMVLLKELSVDRQYLIRLSRDLIERIGVRDNITILLHPDDKESIGMLKEGLEQAVGGLKNLNIETSNQVNRGGCRIETEWNAIDASIETQLQGVYAAMMGKSAIGDAGAQGGGMA